MSCHLDPFPDLEDDDRDYYADKDEDTFGCVFPGECLCPHWHHHSSECFTAADAREWEAFERREARREWWQRLGRWLCWWRRPATDPVLLGDDPFADTLPEEIL